MANDHSRQVGYRLRRALGPWLDEFVRKFADVTYYVYPDAYAGTVECPVRELERRLSANGFAWNPLSMYHYTQLGNRTNGSWVYRRSLLADRQLHVILVEQGEARIDVYAHAEYNWLRRPIDHAREVDLERERGAELMRRLLDEMGVDYHRESNVRRKAMHFTRRCLDRLDDSPVV